MIIALLYFALNNALKYLYLFLFKIIREKIKRELISLHLAIFLKRSSELLKKHVSRESYNK